MKTTLKLICTVVVGALGFTMSTANVSAHEHGAGHKETHADHMLEGYNVVATALYKDDLATAKKAAAGMVKHDKKSSMAPAAQKIAKSKNIADARKNFDALSKAAMPVAKGEKGWLVMHCPMAFDNKGASWLQKSSDKQPNNPYFGKVMPHCGKLVK